MHHRRKLSDSSDEKSKRKNKFKNESSHKYKMVSSSIDPHRMAGYDGAYGYQKAGHLASSYTNTNQIYRNQQDYDLQRYPGSAYYGGVSNKSRGKLYYDYTSSSSDDNYRGGKYRDLSYGRSYKERSTRGANYPLYEDGSRSMFPTYQGYSQTYNQGPRAYGYDYPGQTPGSQRYIGGINSANIDLQGIRRDLASSYEVLPPRRAHERSPYGGAVNYSRASDVYGNSSGIAYRGDPLARPVTSSGIYSNEHYLNGSAAPLYDYREYEALSRPNYSAFSSKWQPSSSGLYDNVARRDRYETGYDSYYRGGKLAYDSELEMMERKYRQGGYPPIREGVLRHSYAANGGPYDANFAINQSGIGMRPVVYGQPAGPIYAPVGVVGQPAYVPTSQLVANPATGFRGPGYAAASYVGAGPSLGAYY
jgi:hypothetical protein